MSGSACGAKKILCCEQQKAQSQEVGGTLDGWFDDPAIKELLGRDAYADDMEAVFSDIEDSTAEMVKAQAKLKALLGRIQNDLP